MTESLFHDTCVRAQHARLEALSRAARMDHEECARIMNPMRGLCREMENPGLPPLVRGLAKQIRSRIDALIEKHL